MPLILLMTIPPCNAAATLLEHGNATARLQAFVGVQAFPRPCREVVACQAKRDALREPPTRSLNAKVDLTSNVVDAFSSRDGTLLILDHQRLPISTSSPSSIVVDLVLISEAPR